MWRIRRSLLLILLALAVLVYCQLERLGSTLGYSYRRPIDRQSAVLSKAEPSVVSGVDVKASYPDPAAAAAAPVAGVDLGQHRGEAIGAESSPEAAAIVAAAAAAAATTATAAKALATSEQDSSTPMTRRNISVDNSASLPSATPSPVVATAFATVTAAADASAADGASAELSFSLLRPRRSESTKAHYSSVRCFQSRRCGGDCAEPRNLRTECTRSASKCDSRLLTRTCVYENLYFRASDKAWMFFADPSVTEPPRLCTAMLRDYFPWAPKKIFVNKPPPLVGDAATLNHTIHVEQKYHSSFGHSLSEQLFGLYWQAAEAQGTWAVDPSAFRQHYDGHLMDTKYMWQENDPETGRATNWLRHVLPLLFDADGALHATHPEVQRHRITRAPWLVVGGYGGRSPYNAETYVPFEDLDRRPTQKFDDEYAAEEKASAFMHYSDYLLARGTRPAAASRFSSLRPEEMVVVMLARPRNERRYMSNSVELFRALKKRFGPRMYPKLVKIGNLALGDLMQLLSNTSVLVSPHGSHNSNIGWMPVGSALVEVHPTGCKAVKGYDTIASLLSMHYEQHESPGGVCSKSFKFTADIQSVVKAAAAAYKRVVETYDETVALARGRWKQSPRRTPVSLVAERRGARAADRSLSADRALHFDEECSVGVEESSHSPHFKH